MDWEKKQLKNVHQIDAGEYAEDVIDGVEVDKPEEEDLIAWFEVRHSTVTLIITWRHPY